MKVKLLTSFLNVLFLGGSLAAYSQQSYSASSQEIKVAHENTHVALAPSFGFTEAETTDFSEVIFANFSYAKQYAVHHRIASFLVSTHKKQVKAYIIFRVLRN